MEESLTPQQEEVKCRNCGTRYIGNFCPICGQKAETNRFTMVGALKETFDLLTNYDRALLRTLFELFTRPGHMMRDYILGHRVCYIRPMQLLVCLTTLYLVLKYLFNLADDGANLLVSFETDEGTPLELPADSLLRWLADGAKIVFSDYISITLLIVLAFNLPAWFCFRNTPFGREMNLTEHFYTRLYVSCQSLVLQILTMPLAAMGVEYITEVNMLLIFLITIWDYSQLMKIRFFRSLWLCGWTYVFMVIEICLLLIPFGILLALYVKS